MGPPDGVVRATGLKLSITGANMPGGPPATEAYITFSDRSSADVIGRDVLIGIIEDSGAGYAFIEAVLPPAEFDVFWEILRHGQPVMFSCVVEDEQIVELDFQCGTGVARPEQDGRGTGPRRRSASRPTVPA